MTILILCFLTGEPYFVLQAALQMRAFVLGAASYKSQVSVSAFFIASYEGNWWIRLVNKLD